MVWTQMLREKINRNYTSIYNNNNNNNNNEKILLTTMLTIKILFTINSLEKKEKTIHSKHCLQFLSI